MNDCWPMGNWLYILLSMIIHDWIMNVSWTIIGLVDEWILTQLMGYQLYHFTFVLCWMDCLGW